MEIFEVKVNLQTSLMKGIRFLGPFFIGFFVCNIILTLHYEGNLDWSIVISGIVYVLSVIFISRDFKQSITIDKNGILLHHYSFLPMTKKGIEWKQVKSISIIRNKFFIKNRIGSTIKIRLPLQTKKEISEVKTFLKGLSKVTGVKYVGF